MRNVGRVLLWLLIAAGAGLAAAWAPDAMAELSYFQADHRTVLGSERLSQGEVLRAAAIPPHASVWDDPSEWVSRLEDHPLVLTATIERELPRRLIITVQERTPVALFPMPVLEPVDRDGNLLPVDPAKDMLDLPILSPIRVGESGAPLTRAERRLLALETARLQEIDPEFMARVSELSLDSEGAVIARVSDPRLDVRFTPPITPARLRQGLEALADALDRAGFDPRSVDLRFAEQVVVRSGSIESARGQ